MKDRRGQQSQLLVFHDVGRHEVNRSVERTNPDALLQEALLEAFHIDGMVQLHHADGAQRAHIGYIRQLAAGGQSGGQGLFYAPDSFLPWGGKQQIYAGCRPRHRPEDCP